MKAMFYTVLLFLISFTVAVSGLSAQVSKITEDIGKSYKIANEVNLPNLDEYIIALNNASLEHYRLKSKGFIMNFDNGLQIEVESAEYLVSKGIIKSSENYPESFSSERLNSVFSLKGGFILEGRTAKYQQKIYKKPSSK